jgi:hypothetical protein
MEIGLGDVEEVEIEVKVIGVGYSRILLKQYMSKSGTCKMSIGAVSCLKAKFYVPHIL